MVRLTQWLVAGLITVLLPPATPARADGPSLGEQIKRIFATPTPTPGHRRLKGKKIRPAPSPSTGASPKTKTGRKARVSPTSAPEEEATPRPKEGKASPTPAVTPTPSASPSPTPTETPTPTPEESPSPSPSASPSPSPESKVATVAPDEIEGYEKNPESVRKLLDAALDLTKRNLDYTYGSADPSSGGMDCSGFIYYVLRENGIKDVPRDASQQYVWVRKAGNFRAVLSPELDSFELDELKPGDLLFWTGTYSVERDPPVTHTMIYVGKEKETGQPIMVGASDGRTYEGEKQFGVSVFDFKTARANAANRAGTHPRFVGYGKIPGLGDDPPND